MSKKKLELKDIPYKGKNRSDYLNLLVKTILDLPFSKKAKRILSLNLPFNENGYLQQSLLFLILDRGVIYRGNNEKPTDWSNNFSISESCDEMIIFSNKKISYRKIKKCFSKVNKHLKGFQFKISKGRYEIGSKEKFWFISYESKKHNKRSKIEHKNILKKIKKKK